MSFPNVVWGSFGDEKVTSSTKIGSLPLGARMITPDGCVYAHAKVSATAGVTGSLYQGVVGISATDTDYIKDLAVAADAAIGATSISVTAGGTTAVTENQFTDGTIFVNDVTGQGTRYRIKGNSAAAAGLTITVNLYPSDPVAQALVAGSSQVGLMENPFFGITLTTADTVSIGPVAGALNASVAANYYCWVQRRGEAALLTEGTVVVGNPVSAAYQNLTGAVGAFSAATTLPGDGKAITKVGRVLRVAASTEYSLIQLELE